MSRARDLQLGFADLEFLRQGVVLERELQVIADFTGSARQAVGPVNAIYAVTASAVYNAFLHLTDPTIPRTPPSPKVAGSVPTISEPLGHH